MPNALFITPAVAKAMMDTFNTQVDAGTAAVINIYDGTVPVDATAAITGTQLAQLVMSATAFGAATTANPSVVTANAITADASADATGIASHFRILTQSAGTVIAQGTVGISGTSSDMTLDTTAITSGANVSITAATVSLPCG